MNTVHEATQLPINVNYVQILHLPQLIEKLVFERQKNVVMVIFRKSTLNQCFECNIGLFSNNDHKSCVLICPNEYFANFTSKSYEKLGN